MRQRLRTSAVPVIAASLGTVWLAYALHTVGALGPHLATLFDTWIYNGLVFAAAVACLVRAAVIRRDRAAWIAMGLGIGAWAGGEVYWTTQLAGLDTVPVPSVADWLYLALYPAAYVALLLLIRRRLGRVVRDVALDGVIAAMAVAALAATLTFDPIRNAAGSGTEVAINLAYPTGDVALLGLVVLMFALSGWRPGVGWLLLGLALGAMAVADCVYLVQAANGTYVAGTWLDSVWPASALLVGAAAWRDRAPARAAPPPADGGRRVVLVPGAAGLLALALVGVGLTRGLAWVPAVLAMTTLLLVTVRMALAFAESQDMLVATRTQARTDALTGLGNRRHLMEDLERQIPGASTEEPLVCVVLDLDGFKDYNDAFGHPAGDELLARLGGRLQGAIQAYGRAYRLGGDEFCVIAHHTPPVAESLMAAASGALTDAGEGFRVTSSAGSASIPSEAKDPTAALRLADRRMYAQKGSDRASPARQSRDVLLSTLRERQPEMYAHLSGVAEVARAVGQRLEMSPEALDEVTRAAELHDLGKIAVPESILNKRGPLDEDEWAFMRSHTVIGERILGAAPALRPVARLVRSSHERWDGAGYPDGLAGADIPLGARIVAVCDSYDAMVSDRPYREAMTPAAAVAEVHRCAGSQFDPKVVTAFEEILAQEPSTVASS